jgi:hypothetical protein
MPTLTPEQYEASRAQLRRWWRGYWELLHWQFGWLHYITGWRPSPTPLWEGSVDRRYPIRVWRDDGNKGKLIVYDSRRKNKIIYECEVGLAYEAMFGADVGDVEEWFDLAKRAIANQSAEQEQI